MIGIEYKVRTFYFYWYKLRWVCWSQSFRICITIPSFVIQVKFAAFFAFCIIGGKSRITWFNLCVLRISRKFSIFSENDAIILFFCRLWKILIAFLFIWTIAYERTFTPVSIIHYFYRFGVSAACALWKNIILYSISFGFVSLLTNLYFTLFSVPLLCLYLIVPKLTFLEIQNS